jgi:hypothetical protein
MAYVAGYATGLLTLDIHTPAAPTLAGQSTTIGGNGGLQIVGEQLYAITGDTSYSGPGFQIISLHTPTNPAQLGGYGAFPAIGVVAVANGIAQTMPAGGNFQLIDVHDPARPTVRGTYPIPLSASSMQLVGDRTYAVGSELDIFDTSATDAPVRLGGTSPNGSMLDIRVVGNLAYIVMINNLIIMDISDPSKPVQIGVFSQTTGYPDAGVDVVGSRAYFATGNQGLAIVDVGDPAHPFKRGAYTGLARA